MTPTQYGTSRLASLIRAIGWETLQDCLAFLEGEGLTRSEAIAALRECIARADYMALEAPNHGWIVQVA